MPLTTIVSRTPDSPLFMRDTITLGGLVVKIPSWWINPSFTAQEHSRKTASSIRLPNLSSQESEEPNAYVHTKKLNLVFGPITACFTSWTLGKRKLMAA